jgi:hypothetical protein
MSNGSCHALRATFLRVEGVTHASQRNMQPALHCYVGCAKLRVLIVDESDA